MKYMIAAPVACAVCWRSCQYRLAAVAVRAPRLLCGGCAGRHRRGAGGGWVLADLKADVSALACKINRSFNLAGGALDRDAAAVFVDHLDRLHRSCSCAPRGAGG